MNGKPLESCQGEGDFMGIATKATSFNAVRNDLNHLVILRKSAGDIVDEVYGARAKESLKCLRMSRVQLSVEDCNSLPDPSTLKGSPHIDSKQIDEISKRTAEHLFLLQILERKRKCPIANVIDNI